MEFKVLHPANGRLNNICELQQMKEVATIEASNLNDAFAKAQNFDEDYAKFNQRSTCIGDILKTGNAVFMVIPIGFRNLSLDENLDKISERN